MLGNLHQYERRERINGENNIRVEIVEEPQSGGTRFRYENEGRTHGRIRGANSTEYHRTYPKIKIQGYHGAATVVVSLVTINGPPYFPHPYNLIGESCRNGVCVKTIDNPEMICCFSDLRIQSIKRREIGNSLQIRERHRIDPFGTGFSHSHNPNEICINAVRLCFQILLPDSNGQLCVPLPPAISVPIYDKHFDLNITKLSHCSAPACGGQEVFLLCTNVSKDDIKIVFYEEDGKKIIWCTTVNILPGDVYSRNIIIFKTPAYKNPNICKKVDCFIQLRRPSDGCLSMPKKFIFRGLSPLSENLGELQRTGQFYDFIINVKDRVFPVHKAILAARSPMFQSMFLHDMKEKITGMIHIPDCEPNIFEDFLFYLYSGKSEKISSSTVTSLYDVAEKYDVKCLKEDCVEFIKGSLTVDLIVDVLILADKYTDEELLEYATEFFISNNQKIILTTKWHDLVVENPVLANELIKKLKIALLMET